MPGTTLVQKRECGILEASPLGVLGGCECTTCHFNAELKRCTGKCQLRHTCTKLANVDACECRRQFSPVLGGILIALVAALIIMTCCTLGGGGGGSAAVRIGAEMKHTR